MRGVREYIARYVSHVKNDRDCVGLEAEFFVFRVLPNGCYSRMAIEQTIRAIAHLGATPSPKGCGPVIVLANRAVVTFEPGGQLEISTHPSSLSLAVRSLVESARSISHSLKRENAFLVSVGFDDWSKTSNLALYLDSPRYVSMGTYFENYGDAGRRMMLQTASLQVSLDLGPGSVGTERWKVANLASALATASFSTSPRGGAFCFRSRTWQELDSRRVGFPEDLSDDPGFQYADIALRSGVMFFQRRDSIEVGSPDWSLGEWVSAGHSRFGFPSFSDIDRHLTTLFPEVRLRGFLEIRGADAVPLRWSAAVAVFWAGLLYDKRARLEALALLGQYRGSLAHLWHTAGELGLNDSTMSGLNYRVWKVALAGATRLPPEFVGPTNLRLATMFFERYVRSSSLGEELLALRRRGADNALQWASVGDL